MSLHGQGSDWLLWTLYFPLFSVLAPFQFFCKYYITWNLITLSAKTVFIIVLYGEEITPLVLTGLTYVAKLK